MRKYLVKALVTQYTHGPITGAYHVISTNYETETILANGVDEAYNLFVDIMKYKFDWDTECDDFMVRDLGPADVYINSDPYADNIRSDYVPDGLDTMTVGELIDALSKFDKDAKVYLKNEKEIWNVFRGLAEYDIEESEILN